jgi:ribosomal protein S18 acetylase RimI-like enzyme
MRSNQYPSMEEKAIRIRAFQLADYRQVMTLWQAVGFRGWSLLTRDQVVQKLRRDRDLFLVACLEGQIVGSVMGSWDGYRGWAHNVAVHPSHQRRGIGRILMSELEKRLWNKGARVLNLHYFKESTWARDFYHSLEFQSADNATLAQKVIREPMP